MAHDGLEITVNLSNHPLLVESKQCEEIEVTEISTHASYQNISVDDRLLIQPTLSARLENQKPDNTHCSENLIEKVCINYQFREDLNFFKNSNNLSSF